MTSALQVDFEMFRWAPRLSASDITGEPVADNDDTPFDLPIGSSALCTIRHDTGARDVATSLAAFAPLLNSWFFVTEILDSFAHPLYSIRISNNRRFLRNRFSFDGADMLADGDPADAVPIAMTAGLLPGRLNR